MAGATRKAVAVSVSRTGWWRGGLPVGQRRSGGPTRRRATPARDAPTADLGPAVREEQSGKNRVRAYQVRYNETAAGRRSTRRIGGDTPSDTGEMRWAASSSPGWAADRCGRSAPRRCCVRTHEARRGTPGRVHPVARSRPYGLDQTRIGPGCCGRPAAAGALAHRRARASGSRSTCRPRTIRRRPTPGRSRKR